MLPRRALSLTCPTCHQPLSVEIDLSNAVKEANGLFSIPIIHQEPSPHIIILYLDENGNLRGVESYDKAIAISVERTEKISMIITGREEGKKSISARAGVCPYLKDPKLVGKLRDPVEKYVLLMCDGRKTINDIWRITRLPMEMLLVIISKYVKKKWLEYRQVIKI